MANVIATKRVGVVLSADEPVTWLEASKVLVRLKGATSAEIDEALRAEAEDFFGGKALLVDREIADADARRGQVYHSKRVRVFCCGFELLVCVSFTICVTLDVPFLDQPARTSQSKFWCSAIITGDGPLSKPGHEQRFAEACDKVEAFAPRILELVKPLYGRAVREVNPGVNEISETGDRFSSVLLQVDDDDFRDELALIECREKTLSQAPSNSALGLLNRLYSGPFAKTYLHIGRKERESECPSDVKLDAILHMNSLRARALLIETRLRNKDRHANWRLLGVTSASEPVDWEKRDINDEVGQLVHSPANVLSAEVAAEIGEQF